MGINREEYLRMRKEAQETFCQSSRVGSACSTPDKGSAGVGDHELENSVNMKMGRVIQFDWRRHWARRVAPHLNEERVQQSLDLGMILLDPDWERGDPPYLLGGIPIREARIVPGKLAWYQPLGRCHWIAFFSMAIGVLNYPDLDWQFMTGDLHTVPVG